MILRLIFWFIASLMVMIIGGLLHISVPFIAAVAVAACLWVIHICCAAANG